MDVTKPYKFIWFGDLHGPKPYKFIGFGWAFISQTPVLHNRRVPHARGEGSTADARRGAKSLENLFLWPPVGTRDPAAKIWLPGQISAGL